MSLTIANSSRDHLDIDDMVDIWEFVSIVKEFRVMPFEIWDT